VSAAIEDMDIRDLLDAIADTDEAALKTTYQNLLEGSKSHLRAFVKLLGGWAWSTPRSTSTSCSLTPLWACDTADPRCD
jgi:hypothetical protein